MKRKLSVFIFGLASACPTFAHDYGGAQISEITSIYDGDSFRANITEWPPIVGERVPIRIAGIDAPELRGKCTKEAMLARKAKQFTVNALRNAKQIELSNIRRGKYFRLLANVNLDGFDLGQQLINNDLAVKYNGNGPKQDWCK